MYKKRRDFRAVVFDMDGTLFDTEHVLLECWQQLAEKYKLAHIEETYALCIGVTNDTTKRVFTERHGDIVSYEEFSRHTTELYWKACEKGYPRMKPGVFEVLDALREAEIPLALASSTRQDVVLRELEAAGLIHYFSYIICGDMVTHSKPDPEIFRRACDGLGVAYEDCYAIEDSHHGIRSAVGAGMRAIMVPDILDATEEIRELTEAVVPSLIEVRDYLLES